MYSRNYTAERSFSETMSAKNSTTCKNVQMRENIPVKSFTDSFAYDRFNRMGTQVRIAPETAPEKEIKKDFPINNEKEEQEHIVSPEAVTLEEAHDMQMQAIPNIPIIEDDSSIWTRLKRTFDADTLLIILAVSMLLFSDNATNDKLTPLALLAILFF